MNNRSGFTWFRSWVVSHDGGGAMELDPCSKTFSGWHAKRNAKRVSGLMRQFGYVGVKCYRAER